MPPPWANPNLSADDIVKQYTQISEYKPVMGLLQERSPAPNNEDNGEDDGGWKIACEVTAKLIENNIPFYPTVSRAAEAANKMIAYYQMRER
jgi:hypothetical protein